MKIRYAAITASLLAASMQCASATETVKIAVMDMLSGPLAGYGHLGLKHLQFMVDKANREKWAGDIRFELVDFDTKMSSQEALSLLKQVDSQRIRYVIQGVSSSSVGIALSEAIQKHNDRNPGREMVYINYAAGAPVMTNERCSYWHFRTDAHVDMKIKAMITHIAADKSLKRVYMLNPNYAFGQDTAKAARLFLGQLRPDIEIVGDDYYPTGQVKDYAPYIAKIQSAKVDALITASFGNDLSLLAKAANDSGLSTSIYTLAGSSPGMAPAFGEKAIGKVLLVAPTNFSDDSHGALTMAKAFRAKFNEDLHFGTVYSAMRLLTNGIREAASTDPVAVASKMEGMRFDSLAGPVLMRKDDHQLQMPIVIDVWDRVDNKKVKIGQDGTSLGWRTAAVIPQEQAAFATTCQMKRPAQP